MKLPSFLTKKVVSIDIGSYETKIVEGRLKNKEIEIDKYFSFLTPEGVYKNGYIVDEELLYYMLKEEFSRQKVTANNGYISIKSSFVFTREITLPNVGKEEIDGILKYQLGEYLPIEPEEYVVQYRTIGKKKENHIQKQNFLLIAVPKKIIESHLSLLENLNLKPTVLDFQSNSITKLIDNNSIINDKNGTEEKAIGLIDLGFNNTNVTISKNGHMQVARIIEFGGDDLNRNILNIFEFTKEQLEDKKRGIKNISKTDEEYTEYNRLVNIVNISIEDIMRRIDAIFKYYTSREIGNEIQRILLYGGLSNINGMDKLFEDYYNIPTMKIQNIDGIFISKDENKYINCISSLIRNEAN